jgi:excisionase family DNA binding protein
MSQSGLIDIERAAKLLAVSPSTVRRFILDGRLAGYKIGGSQYRIAVADLMRTMDGWSTRSKEEPR